MSTIHAGTLRKLLKKGSLTGFEAAKIALAELWEGEHARDPILSDNEQHAVINRLASSDDIQIYRNWIGAFSSICEVNHIAHIIALTVESTLFSLETILERYLTAALAEFQIRLRPEIITEKQLEDRKATQRMASLREKHSLGWIVFMRGEELVAEGEGSLENLMEDAPKKAVEVYRQACCEIRCLIEADRLSISHRESARSLLMRIESTKSDTEILAIMDSTLSAEPRRAVTEPEPALDKSMASGKALYGTGLPEWLEWIDQYHHDGFSGFAILQEPCEGDLDAKYHYKDDWRLLKNHYFQPPEDEIWRIMGLTPKDHFTMRLEPMGQEIAFFMFCRTIMRELAEKTGIPFCEDIDHWNSSLESAVKSYRSIFDSAVALSPRAKKAFEGMPQMVDLEKLQPSSESVSLIRNRLAEPLQQGQWLQDCKGHFLKEMLSGVPREEVEEMFSGLGKDARKRVYGIWESINHQAGGTSLAVR